MEHFNPPANLPVAPDENEPTEDVHFRESESGGTVHSVLTPRKIRAAGVPASRSLQPIRLSMTEPKQRPVRALEDLLSVDDVAEQLLLSRSAIYRLVARRRIPSYRLPGGIRFKVRDVDAYLESRRFERVEPRKYGSP